MMSESTCKNSNIEFLKLNTRFCHSYFITWQPGLSLPLFTDDCGEEVYLLIQLRVRVHLTCRNTKFASGTTGANNKSYHSNHKIPKSVGNGPPPSYLTELIHQYHPSRSLRSSSARLLSIPPAHLPSLHPQCPSSLELTPAASLPAGLHPQKRSENLCLQTHLPSKPLIKPVHSLRLCHWS